MKHGLERSRQTNQNSKQIHVAATKRGKTCASEAQLGFGFSSDWLRKKTERSILLDSDYIVIRRKLA